nr:MAG TPA: hypothetical protein [Caudoviricetes sp.]
MGAQLISTYLGRWTPLCVPSSFYMCFLLTVLGVAKG